MCKFNDLPLGFVKYEQIQSKNPTFVAQTTMLDFDRTIAIWFVESERRYYACIG